jgi:hypothetical protein
MEGSSGPLADWRRGRKPGRRVLSGTGKPPAPAGPKTFPTLTRVACASARSCMAVGTYYPSATGGSEPFTERWNGVTWTAGKLPAPGGIACITSGTCLVAVTPIQADSTYIPLIDSWNGRAWSANKVPITVAGAQFPQFEGRVVPESHGLRRHRCLQREDPVEHGCRVLQRQEMDRAYASRYGRAFGFH